MKTQIQSAIARATRQLERATRENVFLFIVDETRCGGTVDVVSDVWYHEGCSENDCRAALWSYRDDNGVMRAALETYSE